MNILLSGCFAPGTSGTLYGIKSANFNSEPKIFGMDSNLQSNFLPDFAEVFKVDFPVSHQYLQQVINIIAYNSIDVLIPQTTFETLILSENKHLLPNSCKLVSSGNIKHLQFANDKFRITKRAAELGITSNNPIPFSEFEKGLIFLDKQVKSKVNTFFKARNLSGGRGIFKVQYDSHLSTYAQDKPSNYHHTSYEQIYNVWKSRSASFLDYFLEEEFEGEEYSVDIFRGSRGLLIVPRKRLIIRGGISQVNLIEKNDLVIGATLEILKFIDLTGLFGLQFLTDNKNIHLLECNPRIQGTNLATILAGANVIEYAIKEALELPYTLKEPRWGTIFRRNSFGSIIEP